MALFSSHYAGPNEGYQLLSALYILRSKTNPSINSSSETTTKEKDLLLFESLGTTM